MDRRPRACDLPCKKIPLLLQLKQGEEMAVHIRLNFPTFCTSYIANGATVNRLKGEKQRVQLKQTVISQIMSKRSIRAHPLTFDFTFWSVKDYPVYNYGPMAQWILEAMNMTDMLQDINSAVVAEIRIRQKLTADTSKQGCDIEVTRYVKPKLVPTNEI